MIVRPLISLNGNAIVLAAEIDETTRTIVALRGRNATAKPARFSLTRPSGDEARSVIIPAGVLNARRALVTPIAVDDLLDSIVDPGVSFALAHPA